MANHFEDVEQGGKEITNSMPYLRKIIPSEQQQTQILFTQLPALQKLIMELWTTFTIECSHTLEEPIGYPVMHGHSYWIRVYFDSSAIKPLPLPEIDKACQLVKGQLDHKHLNDFMPSPTMESIAEFVFQNIELRPVRIDVERKSIGAGITFYPEAHGSSYWRSRAEHYQYEARHMAKSVDYAWKMVALANERLESNDIPRVNSPTEK